MDTSMDLLLLAAQPHRSILQPQYRKQQPEGIQCDLVKGLIHPQEQKGPGCTWLRSTYSQEKKCLGETSIYPNLGQVKAIWYVLGQSGPRCAHQSHGLAIPLRKRTCPSSLSQRSTMVIPPAGKCAFTVLERNRVTQLGFQTWPGVTDRARGHTFPRCTGTARSSVVHHPPQLTKPDPPHLSAEAVGSKPWVPNPSPEKKSDQFAIPTAKLWPHFQLLSGTKWGFYLADEENYFMYCGYA